MKINPIIPVLFLTLLLFACSSRPSYVLSEKKMEKVLFDIHLAEAEINANHEIFYLDSTRKQEFLNSVLKKHKITEATLDTSLFWYAGHLDKYQKINKNLNNRFAEAAEILRRRLEATSKKSVIDENNGFVLPVDKERFFLRVVDLPNNVYTFKTDTTLYQNGGAYGLQFNILGLSESLKPVVTLCLQCADTAFVKRDTISLNGLFSSSVDILKGKRAKALYGSIYFPEVYTGMGVFIQDFTLYHSYNSLSTVQPAK